MIPLAERVRPKNLTDLIGQEHLLGMYKFLTRLVELKEIQSCIFWGPPGVGKTTLAQIIIASSELQVLRLSAVGTGVKELREALDFKGASKNNLFNANETKLIFIDEIHRFGKVQQDHLLEAVETGSIILIGATTENPAIQISSPLLSRCQVFQLNPLSPKDIINLVKRACEQDEILKMHQIKVVEFDLIVKYAIGDARRALNLLEVASKYILALQKQSITNEDIAEIVQNGFLLPSINQSDVHFDLISAFIKSIRGSDPDASLYWLARMIIANEDPLFICRRLCILAAEDIGLANPNALLLAQSTIDIISRIGMPEGRIVLAECVLYLALSEKSNSGYLAIEKALALARETTHLPVPFSLRNVQTHFVNNEEINNEYQYSHEGYNHFISQNFFPKGLDPLRLYDPASNTAELKWKDSILKKWGQRD